MTNQHHTSICTDRIPECDTVTAEYMVGQLQHKKTGIHDIGQGLRPAFDFADQIQTSPIGEAVTAQTDMRYRTFA